MEAEEKVPSFIDNAEHFAKRREAVKQSEITKKRLVPKHEWVAVRKFTRPDQLTDSGLMLAVSEAMEIGSVDQIVSAPEFVYRYGQKIPTSLKPGDFVIYTAFPMALPEIEVYTGEKDVQLVRYEEIYAGLE